MKKIYSILVALFATLSMQAQGWPAQYGGVMLQGFSWDSYNHSQWTVLESQATDLKDFFDIVWVPQSGRCWETTQVMGYMPYYYFDQNSSFGTEAELRSMIKTFKENGISTMADVVVNHHNTDGWFNFPAETYNGETYQFQSTDICKNDDNGKTLTQANADGVSLSQNNDEGEDWSGCRDLDHRSENVQRIIKAYVKYLKEDLGYEGFRYDMVKGFNGGHVGDYNDVAGIKFSVGECWDNNETIKNWINTTNKKSAAFDFQFHYAMTDAIKNNDWTWLKKHTSIISDPAYRQYAVTFVENHDVQDRGTTTGYTPDFIPSTYILAANAYLLAMPGTPCVFQLHWKAYKQEIKSMIEARKLAGITNMSDTETFQGYTSTPLYYVAQTKGTANLVVAVGAATMFKTPTGYTKILGDNTYSYFLSNNAETAWTDKASGTYEEAFNVTLTAISQDTNAKLVYTLDGTEPTTSSQQAESGSTINITNSCTLKVGLLTNGTVTGTTTKEYTIKPFEPYTFKVYVNADKAGWNSLNFYTWSDNSKNASANWPGDKITTTETVNGKTWYCKEYYIDKEDDVVNFVFNTNTGSPQTVDKTGVTKTSYFEISNEQSGNKNLIIDVTNENTSGINNIFTTPSTSNDNGWYSLNGARYNQQPANRGVYIHQGKKYIIK